LNTFCIQYFCYDDGMAETIMTKHPQKAAHGKEISKQKYDIMRAAIMETLTLSGLLTMDQLRSGVQERLQKTPFPGKIPWYCEVVLLDLEARKFVQRVREPKKPDRFQLWPDLPL
jgi:hypothetical protein